MVTFIFTYTLPAIFDSPQIGARLEIELIDGTGFDMNLCIFLTK